MQMLLQIPHHNNYLLASRK